MLPAASAAAALAQLHNHKLEADWESEGVGDTFLIKTTSLAAIDTFTGLDVGHRGTQTSNAFVDRTSSDPFQQHRAYKRTIFAPQPSPPKRTFTLNSFHVATGTVINSTSNPKKLRAKPTTKAVGVKACKRTPTQETKVAWREHCTLEAYELRPKGLLG